MKDSKDPVEYWVCELHGPICRTDLGLRTVKARISKHRKKLGCGLMYSKVTIAGGKVSHVMTKAKMVKPPAADDGFAGSKSFAEPTPVSPLLKLMDEAVAWITLEHKWDGRLARMIRHFPKPRRVAGEFGVWHLTGSQKKPPRPNLDFASKQNRSSSQKELGESMPHFHSEEEYREWLRSSTRPKSVDVSRWLQMVEKQ